MCLRPAEAPGRGGSGRSARWGAWGSGNGRKEGAGASRMPAFGMETQCQSSAGVLSHPARRWSGEGRAPSLFGFPPPVFQRLSHPVSGLIFHAGEWKGFTVKIYVCSECGWFPSGGRRDLCFPFSFFIRAMGSTVGRWGSESAAWRADQKVPCLQAGREAVRKARQRGAPGGAGASPRPP